MLNYSVRIPYSRAHEIWNLNSQFLSKHFLTIPVFYRQILHSVYFVINPENKFCSSATLLFESSVKP